MSHKHKDSLSDLFDLDNSETTDLSSQLSQADLRTFKKHVTAIDSLESGVDSTVVAYRRARKALKEEKHTSKHLKKVLLGERKRHEATVDKLLNEVKSKSERVIELSTEIANLHQRIDQMQFASPRTKQELSVGVLQDQFDLTQTMKTQFQAELAAVKDKKRLYKQTARAKTVQLYETRQTMAQIGSAVTSACADLKASISGLKQEVRSENLQEQLHAIDDLVIKVVNEWKHTEEQRLQRENKTVVDTASQQSQEVLILRKSAADLQKMMESQNNLINHLQRELDEARNAMKLAQETPPPALQMQLEQLRSTNSSLEKEMGSLAQERKDMESKLEEMIQQNSNQQEELVRQRELREALNEELTSRTKNQPDKHKSCQSTPAITNSNTQTDDIFPITSQKEIQTESKSVAHTAVLTEEYNASPEQHPHTSHAEEIEKLQTELRTLEQANALLQSQCDSISKQNDTLYKDLKVEQEKNRTLHEKQEQTMEQLDLETQTAATLRNSVSLIRQQSTDIDSRRNELVEEIDALKDQLKKNQSLLSRRELLLKQSENVLQMSQERVKDLEEELSVAKSSCVDLDRDAKDLRLVLNQIETKTNTSLCDIQHLSSTRNSLNFDQISQLSVAEKFNHICVLYTQSREKVAELQTKFDTSVTNSSEFQSRSLQPTVEFARNLKEEYLNIRREVRETIDIAWEDLQKMHSEFTEFISTAVDHKVSGLEEHNRNLISKMNEDVSKKEEMQFQQQELKLKLRESFARIEINEKKFKRVMDRLHGELSATKRKHEDVQEALGGRMITYLDEIRYIRGETVDMKHTLNSEMMWIGKSIFKLRESLSSLDKLHNMEKISYSDRLCAQIRQDMKTTNITEGTFQKQIRELREQCAASQNKMDEFERKYEYARNRASSIQAELNAILMSQKEQEVSIRKEYEHEKQQLLRDMSMMQVDAKHIQRAKITHAKMDQAERELSRYSKEIGRLNQVVATQQDRISELRETASSFENSIPNPLKRVVDIQSWWRAILAQRRLKIMKQSANRRAASTLSSFPSHLYTITSPRSPFTQGDDRHYFDIGFEPNNPNPAIRIQLSPNSSPSRVPVPQARVGSITASPRRYSLRVSSVPMTGETSLDQSQSVEQPESRGEVKNDFVWSSRKSESCHEDLSQMLTTRVPKIPIIVSIIRRDGHYLNHKEINQPILGRSNKQTFLHRAVQLGAIDMVEELINRRADPNSVTTKGNTPVHVACRLMKSHRKYVEIFKCLVRQGGDLRKVSLQSRGPLDLIESKQHVKEILRFLKTCPKNNSVVFGINKLTNLLEKS